MRGKLDIIKCYKTSQNHRILPCRRMRVGKRKSKQFHLMLEAAAAMSLRNIERRIKLKGRQNASLCISFRVTVFHHHVCLSMWLHYYITHVYLPACQFFHLAACLPPFLSLRAFLLTCLATWLSARMPAGWNWYRPNLGSPKISCRWLL